MLTQLLGSNFRSSITSDEHSISPDASALEIECLSECASAVDSMFRISVISSLIPPISAMIAIMDTLGPTMSIPGVPLISITSRIPAAVAAMPKMPRIVPNITMSTPLVWGLV